MEETLSDLKKQKLKRNIIYLFKLLAIIFCSVLGSFFTFNSLNILLIIPLFSFSFFTGIDFFIASIIGIVIGNVITYHPYTYFIAIAICIYFLFFIIFKLFKMKSILNHTFSSAFSLFFTYLFFQYITQSFQLLNLAIVLVMAIIISILYSFIIHTFPLKSVFFQNENAFIICCFLFIIYTSLIPSSTIAIILIRVFLLIAAIKLTLNSTLALIAGIGFSMIFIKTIGMEDLFLISIPMVFISFMKEKKKWISLLLYLTSSVLFIWIIHSDNIKYELLETGLSLLLLCLLPQTILQPIQKRDYYYEMYLKNKQEIALKLDEFSNMFTTLSSQFIKSKRSRILQQANIEVFDKLCANCFKNQHCHQNGNHLLVNYVKDGIMNQLNENKIHYIKQNCLKADAYLKLIDNFMNSYLLKKFENDEICVLKDVVSNQFMGFSKIMLNYKEHFLQDKLIVANAFYHNIKEYLEEFHYDILYVNNLSTDEYYQFDIAISNCNTVEIKNKILPIINSLLKAQMEIIDVHLHNLISNYIIISIVETNKQFIDVFYKQNGKEAIHCGDSILTTRYLNQYYLAISDGMGNGIEANEESQFTLDALFSTIKTGMNIQEGIAITNSLLKLKNQYDTYTTIDLVEINQNNLIAKFYKAGAFMSIIIRNEEPIIIENYSLPIGIIDQVQIHPYIIQLQKDDIILMMSDGIIDEYNEEIQKIILSIKEKSAKIINRELYEKFMEIKQIKDDATFAVIVIR